MEIDQKVINSFSSILVEKVLEYERLHKLEGVNLKEVKVLISLKIENFMLDNNLQVKTDKS